MQSAPPTEHPWTRPAPLMGIAPADLTSTTEALISEGPVPPLGSKHNNLTDTAVPPTTASIPPRPRVAQSGPWSARRPRAGLCQVPRARTRQLPSDPSKRSTESLSTLAVAVIVTLPQCCRFRRKDSALNLPLSSKRSKTTISGCCKTPSTSTSDDASPTG